MNISINERVKLFVGRLLRWEMIWTIDGDYDIRLRRVYTRPDGMKWCIAIYETRIIVQPDGTCIPYNRYNGAYVERWIKA